MPSNGLEAGIGIVGRAGPFPHLAVLEQRRRRFPFELGGQALAGPGGIGGGFVEAHMLHRRVGIQRLHARQREDAFAAVIVLQPVERRFPCFVLHPRPAVRQPEFGAAIAAIGDEGLVFAIADRTRGDAEGPQQHLVARRFIVEGKARSVMADPVDAAGMDVPFQRLRPVRAAGLSLR